MDQGSSGRFDIADKVGTQLAGLGRFCEQDGNGFAAWAAIRLCQEHDRPYPAWLRRYLDDVARFILEVYEAAHGSRRELSRALHLREHKTRRHQATRTLSGREMWREVHFMLPGLIDDLAAKQGVPVQTVIKQKAAAFGFPGEQWTQLRDAYKAAKLRSGDPAATS